MAKNPAQELITLGQSVWYDNISRDLIEDGSIKRMIDEWGVRGMTSNPTIFDNAISNSDIYDAQIASLKGKSADEVFEELAIQDIGDAADLLRPIYEESNGVDGFISIEVSPLLARETQATVTEAKRLFQRLDRPNIMIKIPGTSEGLPAIRECLEAGINVNITLLFSVENYVAVAETYCQALTTRMQNNQLVDRIRSVASFFVSRVDSVVDDQLSAIVEHANNGSAGAAEQAGRCLGKFGIANSKIAYKRFQEIFEGEGFAALKAAGAQPQRPLWASTSTKNPDYRDVLYVEELIGNNTVNTVPPNTLEAFVDHGEVAETLTKDVEEAEHIDRAIRELGVDIDALMEDLQVQGVTKFAQSFNDLNESLSKKLT